MDAEIVSTGYPLFIQAPRKFVDILWMNHNGVLSGWIESGVVKPPLPDDETLGNGGRLEELNDLLSLLLTPSSALLIIESLVDTLKVIDGLYMRSRELPERILLLIDCHGELTLFIRLKSESERVSLNDIRHVTWSGETFY